LDAKVHGTLAVLLGRHERLLVLRDALVQDDAVDAFRVEWEVDLGPRSALESWPGLQRAALRRGTPLERTPPQEVGIMCRTNP